MNFSKKPTHLPALLLSVIGWLLAVSDYWTIIVQSGQGRILRYFRVEGKDDI